MIGSQEHPSGIKCALFLNAVTMPPKEIETSFVPVNRWGKVGLDQSSRDRLLRQLDPLAKAAENDTEQALWKPYEQHGLKLNIINSTNHIPR